jgi:membrane protein implicated in regulation of membrane protease activity
MTDIELYVLIGFLTLPIVIDAFATVRMPVEQSMGPESLVGTLVRTAEPISPREPGLALLQGELWRATADTEIPKGAQVRVTRVSGLTLHVASGDKFQSTA